MYINQLKHMETQISIYLNVSSAKIENVPLFHIINQSCDAESIFGI